ncbi:hypothetical protein V8F33_003706 [Rhypophila sp. PSN 637]
MVCPVRQRMSRVLRLYAGWVPVSARSWMSAPVTVWSNMISGLIIFNDDSYEPTGWKTTLDMLAFVAGPLMYGLFTRKTLNILGNISGVCHVGSFLYRLHRCAGYARGAQNSHHGC